MRWMLKGARLFDPRLQLDAINDLLIENETIVGIGKSTENIPTIDGTGKVVFPGFMDMHVHLREPGREDKETIETGTNAAVRGGFTAVACMPNTTPPTDNIAGVQFVISKARSHALCRVYPIACVSKGQAGEELTEMARLHDAGAIAFSDDGKPVKTASLMRRALEYSKMFPMPIIDHCEEPTLSDGVMHEGKISTRLGLHGIPSESEAIAVMRNIALAELTGGKLHLGHLSTARSVELVREAKARKLNVTAEVTIHHLLLTDERLTSYDTNYKINPPLRTETDRKALIEGLKDGTIDCLVSDHAPHTREEKESEFDRAPCGISGVEVLVPLAFSELVKKQKFPLKRLIEALSIRPYEILSLEVPKLQEGALANFTMVDLEKSETIRIQEFLSKGKNSPYDGWETTGVPVLTVVAGKVVMENRNVTTSWNPRLHSPSRS